MKTRAAHVSTFRVRVGQHIGYDTTGRPVIYGEGEPDLYGHIARLGTFSYAWKVTENKRGRVRTAGVSRFRWRATLKARAAGQRIGGDR